MRAACVAIVRELGVTARVQDVRRRMAELGLSCDPGTFCQAMRIVYGDYTRNPVRRRTVPAHGPCVVLRRREEGR